jgi:hypothetical protein
MVEAALRAKVQERDETTEHEHRLVPPENDTERQRQARRRILSQWESPAIIVEKPLHHGGLSQDADGGRHDSPLFHCEAPIPSVHVHESTRHTKEFQVALGEFYDDARWFQQERYQQSLAPHTFGQQMLLSQQFVKGPHQQMFTTLTNNPDFILWGRSAEGMGGFEMSAYEESYQSTTEEGDDIHAIEGDYIINGFPRIYVHPSEKNLARLRQIVTLQNGPIEYVSFVSNNIGTYAHFMMDHLTYWAYLKKVFDNPSTRFIFADYDHLNEERMQVLDPDFNKRIDWIQCDNEKHCSTLVRIRQGGALTVLTTSELNGRHIALLDLARQWIAESYNSPLLPNVTEVQPTVIYYTRDSPNAQHSRKMDKDLEERILKHIKKALMDYNRPERLVIFDGTESFEQQIALFRTATTVIGPHGGGLSNLFWIPDAPSCETRPRVLEFLISPQTRKVQRGYLGKSWYKLYSTAPWLDYHDIFLVPPSDPDTLYISLDDLDEALTVLFAPTKVLDYDNGRQN